MERMQFKIKGMNRDNSFSFFGKGLDSGKLNLDAYEIYNMRLTATDNQTTLALTNEKGTKKLETQGVIITGTVIGGAVLDEKLYIFTHLESPIDGSTEIKKVDRLYEILFTNTDTGAEVESIENLFAPNTDLNLDTEHPLDIIPYFESKDLKKLYWIDGKNQPRMFNICSRNMTVDFLPEVDNNCNVTITKEYGGGIFPAGVIQYAFTMGVLNGQESNIFYVSPLYYITRDNTSGLPVNEYSDCHFKITVDNIDWKNYDFIIVYSILRTAKNGEVDCRRVGKFSPQETGKTITIEYGGDSGEITKNFVSKPIIAKVNHNVSNLEEDIADFTNENGVVIGNDLPYTVRLGLYKRRNPYIHYPDLDFIDYIDDWKPIVEKQYNNIKQSELKVFAFPNEDSVEITPADLGVISHKIINEEEYYIPTYISDSLIEGGKLLYTNLYAQYNGENLEDVKVTPPCYYITTETFELNASETILLNFGDFIPLHPKQIFFYVSSSNNYSENEETLKTTFVDSLSDFNGHNTGYNYTDTDNESLEVINQQVYPVEDSEDSSDSSDSFKIIQLRFPSNVTVLNASHYKNTDENKIYVKIIFVDRIIDSTSNIATILLLEDGYGVFYKTLQETTNLEHNLKTEFESLDSFDDSTDSDSSYPTSITPTENFYSVLGSNVISISIVDGNGAIEYNENIWSTNRDSISLSYDGSNQSPFISTIAYRRGKTYINTVSTENELDEDILNSIYISNLDSSSLIRTVLASTNYPNVFTFNFSSDIIKYNTFEYEPLLAKEIEIRDVLLPFSPQQLKNTWAQGIKSFYVDIDDNIPISTRSAETDNLVSAVEVLIGTCQFENVNPGKYCLTIPSYYYLSNINNATRTERGLGDVSLGEYNYNYLTEIPYGCQLKFKVSIDNNFICYIPIKSKYYLFSNYLIEGDNTISRQGIDTRLLYNKNPRYYYLMPYSTAYDVLAHNLGVINNSLGYVFPVPVSNSVAEPFFFEGYYLNNCILYVDNNNPTIKIELVLYSNTANILDSDLKEALKSTNLVITRPVLDKIGEYVDPDASDDSYLKYQEINDLALYSDGGEVSYIIPDYNNRSKNVWDKIHNRFKLPTIDGEQIETIKPSIKFEIEPTITANVTLNSSTPSNIDVVVDNSKDFVAALIAETLQGKLQRAQSSLNNISTIDLNIVDVLQNEDVYEVSFAIDSDDLDDSDDESALAENNYVYLCPKIKFIPLNVNTLNNTLDGKSIDDWKDEYDDSDDSDEIETYEELIVNAIVTSINGYSTDVPLVINNILYNYNIKLIRLQEEWAEDSSLNLPIKLPFNTTKFTGYGTSKLWDLYFYGLWHSLVWLGITDWSTGYGVLASNFGVDGKYFGTSPILLQNGETVEAKVNPFLTGTYEEPLFFYDDDNGNEMLTTRTSTGVVNNWLAKGYQNYYNVIEEDGNKYFVFKSLKLDLLGNENITTNGILIAEYNYNTNDIDIYEYGNRTGGDLKDAFNRWISSIKQTSAFSAYKNRLLTENNIGLNLVLYFPITDPQEILNVNTHITSDVSSFYENITVDSGYFDSILLGFNIVDSKITGNLFKIEIPFFDINNHTDTDLQSYSQYPRLFSNQNDINLGFNIKVGFTYSNPTYRETKDILDNTVTIVDTHDSSLETVDTSHLLITCLRNKVIPQTMEVKNGTLFLGNLEIESPKLSDSLIKEILYLNDSDDTSSWELYNNNDPDSLVLNTNILLKKRLIPWGKQTAYTKDELENFNLNSQELKIFKGNEFYRLGLQFSNDRLEKSDVVDLGYVKIDGLFLKNNSSIFSNYPAYYLNDDIINKLYEAGFTNVRLMVEEGTSENRSIIGLGIVSPTVFNKSLRDMNSTYAMSSWFFRPMNYYIPDWDNETGVNLGFNYKSSLYLPWNHQEHLISNGMYSCEIQSIASDYKYIDTENINKKYKVKIGGGIVIADGTRRHLDDFVAVCMLLTLINGDDINIDPVNLYTVYSPNYTGVHKHLYDNLANQIPDNHDLDNGDEKDVANVISYRKHNTANIDMWLSQHEDMFDKGNKKAITFQKVCELMRISVGVWEAALRDNKIKDDNGYAISQSQKEFALEALDIMKEDGSLFSLDFWAYVLENPNIGFGFDNWDSDNEDYAGYYCWNDTITEYYPQKPAANKNVFFVDGKTLTFNTPNVDNLNITNKIYKHLKCRNLGIFKLKTTMPYWTCSLKSSPHSPYAQGVIQDVEKEDKMLISFPGYKDNFAIPLSKYFTSSNYDSSITNEIKGNSSTTGSVFIIYPWMRESSLGAQGMLNATKDNIDWLEYAIWYGQPKTKILSNNRIFDVEYIAEAPKEIFLSEVFVSDANVTKFSKGIYQLDVDFVYTSKDGYNIKCLGTLPNTINWRNDKTTLKDANLYPNMANLGIGSEGSKSFDPILIRYKSSPHYVLSLLNNSFDLFNEDFYSPTSEDIITPIVELYKDLKNIRKTTEQVSWIPAGDFIKLKNKNINIIGTVDFTARDNAALKTILLYNVDSSISFVDYWLGKKDFLIKDDTTINQYLKNIGINVSCENDTLTVTQDKDVDYLELYNFVCLNAGVGEASTKLESIGLDIEERFDNNNQIKEGYTTVWRDFLNNSSILLFYPTTENKIKLLFGCLDLSNWSTYWNDIKELETDYVVYDNDENDFIKLSIGNLCSNNDNSMFNNKTVRIDDDGSLIGSFYDFKIFIKDYAKLKAVVECLINNDKFESLEDAKNKIGDLFMTPIFTEEYNSGIYGTEGDHFYGRWECLKTYAYNENDVNQVVDIISVPLESNINLNARTDRNRGVVDNTVMSPKNFNLFNTVYDLSNNFFTYYNSSRTENKKFENQIIWSLTKNITEEIDSWCSITTAAAVDLDGTKGKLNKLKDWRGQLLAFQDKAITYIPFDQRVALEASDGVPIEISNAGKVAATPLLLYDNIGCQNKWSMCVSPNYLYFIDNYNKGIFSIGELSAAPPTCISDVKGFHSWMVRQNTVKPWSVEDQSNFKVSYDTINKEVYFINANNCLVFNEALTEFTSFYSYNKTPYLFSIGSNRYAIYLNDTTANINVLWEGEYNNFFGEFKPYYLTIIANDDPIITKIFNTVSYTADVYTYNDYPKIFNDKYVYPETFTDIEADDEYQHGGYRVFDSRTANPYPLKKKFRLWNLDIPRDGDTINNVGIHTTQQLYTNNTVNSRADRMSNPWLKLTLKRDNVVDNNTNRLQLYDLTVNYTIQQ